MTRAKRTATPAPEAITAVEIVASENGEVPIRTFASLWDADQALAKAFRRSPPPGGRAYKKVWFRVEWADGESHEGRADVSQARLDEGVTRGGILRAHLTDTARWLGSDDFVRMFTGGKPGEEIAAQQAWGKDLDWRLAYDLAAHAARAPITRRRNAPSPQGERG